MALFEIKYEIVEKEAYQTMQKDNFSLKKKLEDL